MEFGKFTVKSINSFSNFGLKVATKKHLSDDLYKPRKHELLIRVFLVFLIDLHMEGLSIIACKKRKVKN
jgi:hypothetical protein